MRKLLSALLAVMISGSSAVADQTPDPAASGPLPALSVADLNGQRYVFVANRTTAEIAVIDTRTDAVISRVPLAGIPHQFVVSGVRAKLVATHLAAKAATVFDLERMRIEAVIDLGFQPEQLELDPAGRSFAVASGVADRLSVVSLKPVEEIFRMSGLGRPSDLMFSRDTRLLFVASGSAPRIAVVDAWQGGLLEQMVLQEPGAGGIVDLQFAGRLGLALHGASGGLSVFDLLDRSLLGTLQVPGPALSAFPTADGRHVLVPNERERSVSIVEPRALREVARLPGAPGVAGINTGMFDSVAFVLSRERKEAVVLDVDGQRVAGEVALPSQPETAIAADAGRKLYVALSGSHQVAVIDMHKRALTKLIDGVGREPWGVNMAGASSYCH